MGFSSGHGFDVDSIYYPHYLQFPDSSSPPYHPDLTIASLLPGEIQLKFIHGLMVVPSWFVRFVFVPNQMNINMRVVTRERGRGGTSLTFRWYIIKLVFPCPICRVQFKLIIKSHQNMSI